MFVAGVGRVPVGELVDGRTGSVAIPPTRGFLPASSS
jgi:hypothetical protein